MPNYLLLATKNPLFNAHFALLSPVVDGSRGLYLYNCGGISILFVSHLAAFYPAFCTKTHCVLHQNALRLAPKRTAFSTKTQCI